MSTKKYLSLEEAADFLRMRPDELLRLRERQEIRGFSDRGTWKFKGSDVEELQRKLQPDSSPEVPMLTDDESVHSSSHSKSNSDSDVRLVFDEEPPAASDDALPLGPISDSDVQLLGDDLKPVSDSDVRLLDSGADIPVGPVSDSDVKLLDSSDSDVKLVRPGSGSLIDDDDSALGGDLGGSLFGGDSDLRLGDESGVKLTPGSSGIQLSRPADSGILLEGASSLKLKDDAQSSSIKKKSPVGDDKLGATIPLMEVGGDDGDRTDPEVPMLFDEEESYALGPLSDATQAESSVVLFDDDDEDPVAAAVNRETDSSLYDLDASDDEADELEVDDDIFGDDEELEELDAFETDDEDFSEEFAAGGSQEFVGGPRPTLAVEPEMGVGAFSLIAVSCLVLMVGAIIGADLLRVVAASGSGVDSGGIIDMVGGLF